MLLDSHVHLLGVGDNGSGCEVSPAMRRRLLFRFLRWRFGLKEGALASTVAHDSHNLIVVGVSDEDMRKAAEHVEKMQGGFAVVEGREVKACLPLPIAGLMSLEPAEAVASQMEELKGAARSLGCVPENPFLTLSFLALPVIPELKITDRGLVDVAEFRIIGLEVS